MQGRRRKRKKIKGETYQKFKAEFKPLTQPLYQHRSDTSQYKSVDSNRINTFKKESQKYTGTLVKGISTLHKSNAVPIINEQEAKDHASMRR